MTTFTKDPNAVLDYYIDWSDWMTTGDVISTSEWSIANTNPDIVIDYSSVADSVAAVWLSGGKIGVTYTITNRITTVGDGVHNRVNDRSIQVTIKSL